VSFFSNGLKNPTVLKGQKRKKEKKKKRKKEKPNPLIEESHR
jgi:hypothetical protein